MLLYSARQSCPTHEFGRLLLGLTSSRHICQSTRARHGAVSAMASDSDAKATGPGTRIARLGRQSSAARQAQHAQRFTVLQQQSP